MAYNYIQGKFQPRNPHKYNGDVANCLFRSSWERTAMRFCDETDSIVQWSSEEIVIPYLSPVDGKMHRYFVDLLITVKNAEGKYKTFLIEIKPEAQVRKPRKTAKKSEIRYIEEVRVYAVNQAKWLAARQHCKKMGWEFVIWTEKHLTNQTKKYKRVKSSK